MGNKWDNEKQLHIKNSTIIIFKKNILIEGYRFIRIIFYGYFIIINNTIIKLK